MRLSQTKFFRKIFIYFFALASMLTTCNANEVKKEDQETSSTTPKQFNKNAGVIGLTLLSIIGIFVYKSSSSESEQTQPSLNTNSTLLGQQQQGSQQNPPIHNANSSNSNSTFLNQQQQGSKPQSSIDNSEPWFDEVSSDSSSSSSHEYHSDEEKEEELYSRHICNSVTLNEDDRARGTSLLARRQQQGNQTSWQALREPQQVDTEVQDYLSLNYNDDELSANAILDNARQDKKNDTDPIEDNDSVPDMMLSGVDVEKQKKQYEYWNSQKQNIVHSNSQKEQKSKPGGKEKKFEEYCALCTISIVPNKQGIIQPVFKNSYFNNVGRTVLCCHVYLHYGCIKQLKEQYRKRECIICRNTKTYPEWLKLTYENLKLQDYPEPEYL